MLHHHVHHFLQVHSKKHYDAKQQVLRRQAKTSRKPVEVPAGFVIKYAKRIVFCHKSLYDKFSLTFLRRRIVIGFGLAVSIV